MGIYQYGLVVTFFFFAFVFVFYYILVTYKGLNIVEKKS